MINAGKFTLLFFFLFLKLYIDTMYHENSIDFEIYQRSSTMNVVKY